MNAPTGLGRWAWVTDSLLFLSSYVVLFAALGLRFQCPSWLPWVCWGLAGLGTAAVAYLLVVQRFLTADLITVNTVEDRGPDVAGYVATYLLPLVVVAAPTNSDLLAYLLVFAAMGLIYVRSRLIQINPTLYFFGYRLFRVSTEDGFEGYLLTIGEPRPGDQLRVVQRDRLLLDLRFWLGGTKSAS
jgi:hypothetical protein